jgi:hypothetical protein
VAAQAKKAWHGPGDPGPAAASHRNKKHCSATACSTRPHLKRCVGRHCCLAVLLAHISQCGTGHVRSTGHQLRPQLLVRRSTCSIKTALEATMLMSAMSNMLPAVPHMTCVCLLLHILRLSTADVSPGTVCCQQFSTLQTPCTTKPQRSCGLTICPQAVHSLPQR